MHSGSEIVPWFGSHHGKCWGLANPCWLGFLKWEKDLEIPLRSFLTSRNMVWLQARETSPTSIWSEQTTGPCSPAVSDESTNNAGRKRTSRQSPRHRHRRRRRLTCLTLQLFFPWAQAHERETSRRRPHLDQSRTKTKRCKGRRQRQDCRRAHTKSEKRAETHEATHVKRRETMKNARQKRERSLLKCDLTSED